MYGRTSKNIRSKNACLIYVVNYVFKMGVSLVIVHVWVFVYFWTCIPVLTARLYAG